MAWRLSGFFRRHRRLIAEGLAFLAALYIVDDLSARFGIPTRDRFSVITVNRFYLEDDKYNKFSYLPLPPVDTRCVNALFPHSGSMPCWYVRKHRSVIVTQN